MKRGETGCGEEADSGGVGMEANRGMVAGSRGGVVTIRHDGDGAAVRPHSPPLFGALLALSLGFVPSRFDLRRGTCRSAVRPCAAGRMELVQRPIGGPCGRCVGCLGSVASA